MKKISVMLIVVVLLILNACSYGYFNKNWDTLRHIVFTPGVDTKETIIETFGKPDFTINVNGNNKEVLYYDDSLGSTFMYAIVDNIYQEKLMDATVNIEHQKKRGTIESEAKKIFRSFQQKVPAENISRPLNTN